MAFDGITVAGLVREMRNRILNGRISKIAQPEEDELILTIKVQKDACRLLMSANASLPLLYFTDKNKPGPVTAPNFCMLLRKHIGNGRIIDITQPGLERIVDITVEHLNEMGDLCTKHLIIELMGKHSNIIFCNDEDQIIDSIKHVSAHRSSVREVLPGRPYFIPETQSKLNPFVLTEEIFQEKGSLAVLCQVSRDSMQISGALKQEAIDVGYSPEMIFNHMDCLLYDEKGQNLVDSSLSVEMQKCTIFSSFVNFWVYINRNPEFHEKEMESYKRYLYCCLINSLQEKIN